MDGLLNESMAISFIQNLDAPLEYLKNYLIDRAVSSTIMINRILFYKCLKYLRD
jgi:hypothetical protein